MEGKKGSFGGMKKSAWGPKASSTAPKVTYVSEPKEEKKEVKEEKTIKLPLDCVAEYTRDFIPAEKRKELYETLLKKVTITKSLFNKRFHGKIKE